MNKVSAVFSSAVLMPLCVILSTGPAQAAPNPSCGEGYKHVESAAFANGEVVLTRKGDTWCSYVRRTGSYYGKTGLTRVVLSAPGGREVINEGSVSYSIGPVYLKAPHAYAFGVVGTTKTYKFTGVTATH